MKSMLTMKSALILIPAAALIVLLFVAALVVVLVLVNKKKKASQSVYPPRQNPNMYRNVPQQPLPPQTQQNVKPVNPPNAQTVPLRPFTAPAAPQRDDLIRYTCFDTGSGGMCAMCKAEADRLYRITASRDGKTKSLDLCENCARKTIRRFQKENESAE